VETLETPLIEKVLHQLAEMGTLGLTLSGGEVFLHPDVEKILQLACQLDFSISILSNLTPMKSRHISLLKEINPSLVQTSLYSMDADEHDRITQLKGSHTKTLKALELLIENDIPVQISCPVMRTNLHAYRSVLEWAQRHRCKAQTDFIMMARTDFSTENLVERITLEEQELLLKDILEVDIDYGGLLEETHKLKTIEERANEPVCGVAVDNLCLSASGTFYPCSGWQGLPVGDARTQNVRDIWENSPQLNELRQITKGSFPRCLSCTEQEFCAMCLVRNFNESNGDMFKINPHFCESAALNRKLVKEHYAKIGRSDYF
jgi:radical SAM protein with 4Fe4S-binding SPASM domain